jgi:hypothetical protein
LVVADLTDGLSSDTNCHIKQRSDFDEQTQQLAQTYYLNFPQRSEEKADPRLLLPAVSQQVHQNSIFDLTWLGDTKIVTASGDQSGVVFDIESQHIEV